MVRFIQTQGSTIAATYAPLPCESTRRISSCCLLAYSSETPVFVISPVDAVWNEVLGFLECSV